MEARDLERLTVDPLLCTTISLKASIRITQEIIHEASVMPSTFLIALRYREGGDEQDFSPNLMPGYTNVSLVSDVEMATDGWPVVRRRYCVIEIWRFRPEKRARVCYLWTIGDDSASMKVLLEDLWGRFLTERHIRLDDGQVDDLKFFYHKLVRSLMEKLMDDSIG